MSDLTTMDRGQIARIAARINKPIVVVGLMGVGKSTVGRRLAEMIGSDFVDADDEIERAAQRSISEIFEEFGEAYFRDGERRVIGRLMDESHGVIATGGGAFVDPETRALILENAIAVWINSDIDTLVERTSRRNTPTRKWTWTWPSAIPWSGPWPIRWCLPWNGCPCTGTPPTTTMEW